MTDFTRLTIVASRRKAEIVVPSDESLGALIPQLMDLLDEPARSGDRPLTLVLATGEQLDLSLSTSQQLVRDGSLLRLIRIEDAPPPPEVSDVTDVVADTRDSRSGLWSTPFRHAIGAIGVSALTAVSGAMILTSLHELGFSVISALWCVLLSTATLLGRGGLRSASIAVTAAASGFGLPLGLAAARAVGPELPAWIWGIGSLSLTAVALGLCLGVGQRNRPALLGSVVALPTMLLPALLMLAGVSMLGSFGVAAVVAVAAAGLVPWYALSASGLTGLDDQVMDGARLARERVLPTLGAAYQTMTWTTIGVTVPIAISTSVLLLAPPGWATGLGCAILLVTAARTRAYPLAGQSIALWMAVLIPLIIGLNAYFTTQPITGAVVAAGLALTAALLSGVRPPRHQRARLRRVGNIIEALSVIALLPLLLGVFDVFSDLLDTF
ncbi:MAG: EsaB/YukD family protein [Rhodoglobus sp.]